MSILHFAALLLGWFIDFLAEYARDFALVLTGVCLAWVTVSLAQRDAIGGLLAVATMLLIWIWAVWARRL